MHVLGRILELIARKPLPFFSHPKQAAVFSGKGVGETGAGQKGEHGPDHRAYSLVPVCLHLRSDSTVGEEGRGANGHGTLLHPPGARPRWSSHATSDESGGGRFSPLSGETLQLRDLGAVGEFSQQPQVSSLKIEAQNLLSSTLAIMSTGFFSAGRGVRVHTRSSRRTALLRPLPPLTQPRVS